VLQSILPSFKSINCREEKQLEIDQYGLFEADTEISKISKSCFPLHYQKYDVFDALSYFQKLKNQEL